MPKRYPDLLIEDMLECIRKIERYTAGLTRARILADEKTMDAIFRNLEVIGEAANGLPADVKAQASTIPWREVIGMRHRLIHDYAGVNWDMVFGYG